MPEYARVIDGAVVELRTMQPPPAHKAHLWRDVVREGEGPLEQRIVESNVVRIVRTERLLDDIKRELLSAVVDAAERQRGVWLTMAVGKTMSYAEKAAEARLILDDASIPPPAAAVPILTREAAVRGLSLLDMAQLVINRYLACKDAEASINEVEVRAVIAISAASDAAAARAAYEAVQWPSTQ